MKKSKKAATPTITIRHLGLAYANTEHCYKDAADLPLPPPEYLDIDEARQSPSYQELDTDRREEAKRTETYTTVVQPKCCDCPPLKRSIKYFKIAFLVSCMVILGLLSGTGYLLYVHETMRGIGHKSMVGYVISSIDANYSESEVENLPVKFENKLIPVTVANNPCSTVEPSRHKTSTNKEACKTGWVKYEQSCYLLSQQVKRTFTDAATFCSNRNASLVVIETEAENDFLQRTVKNNHWKKNIWIGLVDLENNEKWVWIGTFKRAKFLDWAPVEPNYAKTENCAMLWYEYSYHWNNVQCKYNGSIICEQK